MATHLTRRAQLGVQPEGTEGVFETTWVTGDYTMTLEDIPTWSSETRLFDRRPVKADFSTDPALVGGRLGTVNARFMLAGSGGGATTVPGWSVPLVACGWQQGTAQAWTGTGPFTFTPGEQLTQATSNATCLFIGYDPSNTNVVITTPETSGTFDTNTLTGDISAETVVGTSGTDFGIVHWPDSAVTSSSARLFYPDSDGTNGVPIDLAGARGDWTMTVDGVGQPVYLDLTFRGKLNSTTGTSVATVASSLDNFVGLGFIDSGWQIMGARLLDVDRDETFDGGDITVNSDPTLDTVTLTAHGFGPVGTTQVVTYTEGTVAVTGLTDGQLVTVRVTDANTVEVVSDDITVAGAGTGHTFTPQSLICQTSFSITSNTELVPRDCSQDAQGYKSVLHGGRNLIGRSDPEMVDSATHNFFAELQNGSTGIADFKLGSAAGDRVWVAVSKVAYRDVSGSDRNTLATLDTSFGVHRQGVAVDNEMFIVTY